MAKYDSKVRELTNKLSKLMTGCFVCGKSIKYPYLSAINSTDKIIRCKEHQKKYAKFWFDKYQSYIAMFRGQT